jgi:HK97 family phage major capsid protein
MPTGNSHLIAQLEQRKQSIKVEALSFLGELERRGLRANDPMPEASLRKFNKYRTETREIQQRIDELKADDARSYENSEWKQKLSGKQQFASQSNAVAPLHFDAESLRQLHTAIQSRQSRQITARAYSSADPLLPPQLWPDVLGPIHESRVLDRLPVFATSLPMVRYVRHTSTTGSPALVAEGAVKPELVLNVDYVDAAVVKLAAHVGVSEEIIDDWDTFYSYVQQEIVAQVIDVENAEVLAGNGTSGHLTGLSHVSGILTHDATADTGTGVTAIDSIEKSIAALRTGPSLAVANLLVLHPNTWSALRRLKDTSGRFLFIGSDSDPTQAEANSIFGVNVLVTTQQAAGSALLLDTTKFGRALVRSPLTLKVGYTQDDFVRNIVRVIAEERFVLQVERPSAVLQVTGLPTA